MNFEKEKKKNYNFNVENKEFEINFVGESLRKKEDYRNCFLEIASLYNDIEEPWI